ncbi:MAG: RNA-binding S4 domain-containing protein [Clostridiaceae bacterium]|nr:RNA-binding S4 domain-containing protein [Clostridiaceae bacterium]MDY5888912.1 RNA-binding S4 domain-containing protein [Oscillospiraceae bacterium]
MLNKRKIKLRIKEKEVIQKHISTDFIRLDAFLKLCDAVQSGGHAKIIIQDGEIKLNGEVCVQRGKKLHVGDKVKFENIIYEIV